MTLPEIRTLYTDAHCLSDVPHGTVLDTPELRERAERQNRARITLEREHRAIIGVLLSVAG